MLAALLQEDRFRLRMLARDRRGMLLQRWERLSGDCAAASWLLLLVLLLVLLLMLVLVFHPAFVFAFPSEKGSTAPGS